MCDDINILLLGQTGVGKSTFVNAFINVLLYNTLDEALNNRLKVLIPCSFFYTDEDTFEEENIFVGQPSRNENTNGEGQSCTAACRSYVFHLSNRRIRLIDVPGVGDTRGIEYDDRNFINILSYIRQYEYLNGICVLLRPDMTRLDLYFRYCITELLRHLHVNAKENLMFVFTHARSTFFKPGDSARLIKSFLNDLKMKNNVEIPFNRDNSFLFDNEAFRYIAIHQKIGQDSLKEKDVYSESWKRSFQEYYRLIERILQCKTHRVKDTQSLNDAQNLIHRLARPVAETARFIEENIALAQQHKTKILEGAPKQMSSSMPQKEGRFVSLNKRLTVCISPKCTKVVEVNGDFIVDYHMHCHDDCQLQNAVQECIGDPVLRHCFAMNSDGFCKVCSCEWMKHMHITYEFKRDMTYIDLMNEDLDQTPASILPLIGERIRNLRREADEIRKICVKLSVFIKKNSITPINDDLIEYLQLQLNEEKQKQTMNAKNDEVIVNLEQMIKDHKEAMKIYNETIISQDANFHVDADQIKMVFDLVKQLYQLPINGKLIEEQVQLIEQGQLFDVQAEEITIDLSKKYKFSQALLNLNTLLDDHRN